MKKKELSCNKCIHFRKGFCRSFNFKPRTKNLAYKCKEYANVSSKKNPKLKRSQNTITKYKSNAKPTKDAKPTRVYRKSCKTCEHFKFSHEEKTRLETVKLYRCEVTGEESTYLHKEYCYAPTYVKKK